MSINHVALPTDSDLKASLSRGSLLQSDIGTNPDVQFVAYSSHSGNPLKYAGTISSLNSQGVEIRTKSGKTTPRKAIHQFAFIGVDELLRMHELETKWWEGFNATGNASAVSRKMQIEQQEQGIRSTSF